ncbi:hypothetical protein KC322_g38 [Hortaea werneckii]|nr:hypothetical protein KC322_g38 [Hortaea werneckii]
MEAALVAPKLSCGDSATKCAKRTRHPWGRWEAAQTCKPSLLPRRCPPAGDRTANYQEGKNGGYEETRRRIGRQKAGRFEQK